MTELNIQLPETTSMKKKNGLEFFIINLISDKFYSILQTVVSPTLSGIFKSSEHYCEWEL